MLRSLLIKASESPWLRKETMRRSVTRNLAMKFIAGDSLDAGLSVAHQLAETNRTTTLDYLGEAVTDDGEARAASKVYLEALGRVGEEGLPCGISVKATQLGLRFSAELCLELLDEISSTAGQVGAHVTIDMEGSDVTEKTVRLVEDLHAAGHRNVGCAVQSYLKRTRADVERLSRLPASLRLCKGAYAEPPEIAYQSKRAVDANYALCAEYLLEHGKYARLATHDHRLIHDAKRVAARLGLGPDTFEFQMLYGVRTGLQRALVEDGYAVRVYVPFGTEWYPYYMRRMAERPANLVFFLRSLRDT